MAKIMEATEEEKQLLETAGRGRHGTISAFIIKAFRESNLDTVRIDVQGPITNVASTLRAYVRNHDLPYLVVQRQGKLFLTKVRKESPIKLTEEVVDEHIGSNSMGVQPT